MIKFDIPDRKRTLSLEKLMTIIGEEQAEAIFEVAKIGVKYSELVHYLKIAMCGKNGADQERIAKKGLEWICLILKKNLDYGSSVFKTPILAPELPVGEAIFVRMSDKIERIRQLRQGNPNLINESLEDTLRDLGAYCLLHLCQPTLEEQFTDPLNLGVPYDTLPQAYVKHGKEIAPAEEEPF